MASRRSERQTHGKLADIRGDCWRSHVRRYRDCLFLRPVRDPGECRPATLRAIYRFSLDWKLLSAFALSFMAAIGGTALSLISKPNLAVLLIASELAAVILVLRLLLFAYRRALHLVNPVEQLQMIVAKAERNLRQIDRQIRWTSKPAPEGDEGKIDAARRAIFDASPRWYPRLFARRASEERALAIQRFELDPDGSGQRHVRRKSFAAERSF